MRLMSTDCIGEDIDEDLSFEERGFFDKRETTQLYKSLYGSPRVECFCYRTPFGNFSESDGAVYQW